MTNITFNSQHRVGFDDENQQAPTDLMEMAQRYLSYDYLTQKVNAKLKEKILPFSNPPGWEQKMKEAKSELARRSALKISLEHQLKQVDQQLRTMQNCRPLDKKKIAVEQQHQLLQERYKNICNVIKHSQTKIAYFEKQRAYQISSRFAGYFGTAANTIIPGAGLLVSLLVTGTTTAIQEELVDDLEDPTTIQQERKNVRFGTLCTIACTATSIAFSLLAMPLIKEAAGEFWGQINETIS